MTITGKLTIRNFSKNLIVASMAGREDRTWNSVVAERGEERRTHSRVVMSGMRNDVEAGSFIVFDTVIRRRPRNSWLNHVRCYEGFNGASTARTIFRGKLARIAHC